MHARREDPYKPAWIHDRLESTSPPEIEAPYFDEILSAWVLSRYQDVMAALQSRDLLPAGAKNVGDADSFDEESRLTMREEILGMFQHAQLQTWRSELAPEAQRLAESLPIDDPVDLVGEYGRPSCLVLAAMVTGLEISDPKALQHKAREISAAAAEPYDTALSATAKLASAELRSYFSSGPESLRESGFVALSQTLPCILGNAWYVLLTHPSDWLLLHQEPGRIEQGMEELLRYAGLVRVLFRKAKTDVLLNGCLIRKGDRVILRTWAANRDPDSFPDANKLNIHRRGAGPLTFGAGPHACVAGSLLRMAAAAVTQPLLKRFGRVDLAEPVQWSGGTVFRSPASLQVRLSELPSA